MIGVSYDSPEVLREFAEAKGISFPLLSDRGSRLITQLGLLDRDLEAHHAVFGIQTKARQQGVAYSGVFVLDETGRVVQKRVQDNYRAREGTPTLLENALGITPSTRAEVRIVSTPKIRVSAYADSDSYVRWQKTRLHVEVDVEAGWHVYGRPIPQGFTPLTVEIESQPEVELGEPTYSQTRPFKVEGLDDNFYVHEGHIRVSLPIAINVALGRGEVNVQLKVRYQACSDAECLPPSAAVYIKYMVLFCRPT